MEVVLGLAVVGLIACGFLCLYRIAQGPTAPDRIVSVDAMGTLLVAICGVLAVSSERSFFIDIAITWALISFTGTIALSKYLEGRKLDD